MRKHYHLIGIGGTAMASLAGLLKAAGHSVTGSDENVYPPMSTLLERLGIAYSQGYRPENLPAGADIVIVGNAISRGNPELEAVLVRKLYYTSAAATIKEEFLRGRHTLAVAGTHGKTTTASLLAWILEVAGLDPSFLIGGVAENFGTSFRLVPSAHFVIEADEYDTAYFDKGPKFWHYLPDTAIVNNVEFDHADIYRDDEAYRLAFERFINLIPSNGTLVAGWGSEVARQLSARSFAPVESFGFDGDAGHPPRWSARDVRYGETATRFVITRDGEAWIEVETQLAGAFNVRNCLAAAAAAFAVGVTREEIAEALRTFKSVRRRLELRGTADDVTVIDDFAHHPTAVRETIRAARQRFPDRRLIAVFEPRSYTAQRREFQEAYVEALGLADEVVIAGLFHPERYTRETAIDPDEMTRAWRTRGLPAMSEPDPEAIARVLTRAAAEAPGDGPAGGARRSHVDRRAATLPHATPGSIVLVMSNGGFGGIHDRLLNRLRRRASGEVGS